MNDNLKSMVIGLMVRHALTSLAATLVTLGVLGSADQTQFTTIGTGIVVGLVSVGWAWWQKVGHVEVLKAIGRSGGKAAGLFLLAYAVLGAGGAIAADMPTKAAATPFVLGYSGNGWYKGVGTFAEMNDAVVAGGNVTTAGGALQGVVGYQWANAGGGTFGAIQGSFAYHNVGGSNVAGSITSKWSGEALVKFGGPITNVLQWLPAGVSMPVLPAVGSAVGSAHPWIGAGVRVQDAKAIIEDASKHNVSAKAFLAAGVMQQYCTNPVSCLTMDTFFEFNPSQDGFSVLGTSQKLGKGYRGGVNLYF